MSGNALASLVVAINGDSSGFKRAASETTTGMLAIAKGAQRAAGAVNSSVDSMIGMWRSVTTYINHAKNAVGLFQKAVTMLAFGKFTSDMLKFSGEAERAITALNVLTNNVGRETYENLRQWAYQMPVNTNQAIDMFIRLRARGIEPTLKQMTLLSDTMSAVGTDRGMYFLSKAIGDISSHGRLRGREINQLANTGINMIKGLVDYINANEDVASKLGFDKMIDDMSVSTQQVGQLISEGLIDSQTALDALFAYMESSFGGISSKMMDTWGGLLTRLRDKYEMFMLQVGESGPFVLIKSAMKDFITFLDSEEGSAQMVKWAEHAADVFLQMSQAVLYAIEAMSNGVGYILNNLGEDLDNFANKMSKIIGAVAGFKAGAAFGGSLANLPGAAVGGIAGGAAGYGAGGAAYDITKSLISGEDMDALTNKLDRLKQTYSQFEQDPIRLAGFDNYMVKLKNEIEELEETIASFTTKGEMKDGITTLTADIADAVGKGADFIAKQREKIQELREKGIDVYDWTKISKPGELPQQSTDPQLEEIKRWQALIAKRDEDLQGWTAYKNALGNITGTISNSVIGAFKSMESAIVNFAMTGKFEIGNFVNYVIEAMATLMVQRTIMTPIAHLMDGVVSGLIGGAMPTMGASNRVQAGTGGHAPVPGHKPLASGGNIYEPIIGKGLRTGSIYEFGESGRGVEHVTNSEKKTGTGDVKVTIVNNTGTEANAKIDQREGAGGEKQLTIELTKALIKNDIAKRGPFSQTMEAVYGLRRGG